MVPLPSANKAASCKWAYKHSKSLFINRSKRLVVAKSYTQVWRFDYYDTIGPAVVMVTLTSLPAITATKNWVWIIGHLKCLKLIIWASSIHPYTGSSMDPDIDSSSSSLVFLKLVTHSLLLTISFHLFFWDQIYCRGHLCCYHTYMW